GSAGRAAAHALPVGARPEGGRTADRQLRHPHQRSRAAGGEHRLRARSAPPGNGYATEAATEIIRFSFEELGLHRIWSWCVAENLGSARVLEKVGMRQERQLREKEFYKGRWWDHRLFAILDHEWKARSGR